MQRYRNLMPMLCALGLIIITESMNAQTLGPRQMVFAGDYS